MPLNYLPLMAPVGSARPARQVVASQLTPWTPLARPMANATVALLTSSAVRLRDQPRFLPRDDTTYRAIPFEVSTGELEIDHGSPVGADARRDLEIVVPRRALADLAHEGVVGAVAPHWFSFYGGIRPLPQVEADLAPALAGELLAARADLAILIPY